MQQKFPQVGGKNGKSVIGCCSPISPVALARPCRGRSMPMFQLHLPMADKMYAADYYSTEGADAIIDVWEKNILNDDEIRSLMGKIDGAIFEDSIELACATIPWTNRFAEEFRSMRGYDILPYLPILQSLKGSSMEIPDG